MVENFYLETPKIKTKMGIFCEKIRVHQHRLRMQEEKDLKKGRPSPTAGKDLPRYQVKSKFNDGEYFEYKCDFDNDTKDFSLSVWNYIESKELKDKKGNPVLLAGGDMTIHTDHDHETEDHKPLIGIERYSFHTSGDPLGVVGLDQKDLVWVLPEQVKRKK